MKTKTPELRLDAKTIAKNLVAICGSKKEALTTLVEGARNLDGFSGLLYNVSCEIQCVRESSLDAFNYRYAGRTRKGGTPSLRRYI